jgi:hypothetical protein
VTGGTIVVTGVTGLSLAAWNARVLPSGGTAGAGDLPVESHAFAFDTAYWSDAIAHLGLAPGLHLWAGDLLWV